MNLLSKESSPYLLQHKNNPVDWLPWGEEAFEKAKKENKLVLISVGYSACHWCHVMERECFEDEEVALFMNKYFVSIKVDREERPDVDQLYMEAVQLMTQSGGWPLNCFTLPNGKPFFGGTYFPKQKWMHTLNQLIKLQKEHPDKLVSYSDNLSKKINDSPLFFEENNNPFSSNSLIEGLNKWKTVFDLQHGGTLNAPKFPLPNNYLFLLNQALLDGDKNLEDYVYLTLDKMSQGGLYDQIGGGFSRYTVDEVWKAPHFEKMLYDNALLINLYAHSYSITKSLEYKRVLEESISFCTRELLSSAGFCCALDADSEGEEGKFYVWSETELKKFLQDDFDLAARYFNFNSHGFWEGNFIPIRKESDVAFAKRHNLSITVLSEKINSIKKILLNEREKRTRPDLDTKVLTSWNALLISSLAKTALLVDDTSYCLLAEKTAALILQKHFSTGEVLYRTLRNTEPIEGFLDDYALLIDALVSLFKATGKDSWLKQAKQLLDLAIDLFYDQKTGFFYYSSNRHVTLAARQVDMHDDVIPSSCSVLANNLHTLSVLFDNEHYNNLYIKMLNKVIPSLEGNLFNYSNWGILLQKVTYTYKEVVIVGDHAISFLKELNKTFIPNTLIVASTTKSEIPIFKNRFKKEETLIFVCENNTCKAPVNNVKEAMKLLF